MEAGTKFISLVTFPLRASQSVTSCKICQNRHRTRWNSFSDDFSFSLASPVKHVTLDASVTLFALAKLASFVLMDENVSMLSLALSYNS